MKNQSKRGGKLVGASHAEGGIDIITPNGKIEAEGEEVIINKAAAKKHCELLSEINQSAGNGVAIPCDGAEESEIAENGTKVSPITTHVQYESAILETVGKNNYLRYNGQSWKLTDDQLSDLLKELEAYSNPMTAANYLVKKDKTNYEKITMENNQLKAGIEVEKEHMDTYNALKARIESEGSTMPVSPEQFFALIAQDHLNENPDYYNLIKTYVEPDTMKEGGPITDIFYKVSDRVNIKNTKSVVGTIKRVILDGATIKQVEVLWDHGDTDLVNPDNIEKNFDVKEPEPAPIMPPKNINSQIVSTWDKVPVNWKNTKTINEVKYINSPYDKGLINLLKPFLSTDNLRPIMAGINFDANGITATDAHKLITLPYPNTKYKGVYSTGSQIKTYFKGEEPKNDMFSGRYPDYERIISPPSEKKVYEFSVYKLLQYTRVAQEYCNKVTWQVAYKYGEEAIGFNSKFLVEELEALLKLGHETAYAFFEKPNNQVIFSPDKDYEVGKSEILLLMPVMLHVDGEDIKQSLGSRDLDFARQLNVYFDFTDNNIHNSDGSVAEFKMNYGEYDVLGPDAISLLKHYNKTGSKSLVVVLENFIVKGNTIFASDIETDISIINPNSQMTDGVYRIVNGAVEFDAFTHVDNYVEPIKPENQDYKFIISAGVLKYYLEKAYDYTGNDDLRPIMSGFNIEYKAGKMTLFATNAHVLLKADLTPYVEVNKDQIDFSVVVSKNNILEFLDYAGEDALIFKANSKYTTIQSSGATFNSRNIDGRYPNAEAVIPRGNYKKLTLNIKDLYNCLKSEDAVKFIKEFKKETVNIYDKLSETPGVLDIFLGYYSYERGETKLEKEIKICSVAYTYEENPDKYLQTGSLLLIMPVMRGEPTHFAFQEKLFHQILDTCSAEEISFEYSEPNRAYIVPGESFDYSQTVSAKKQPKSRPAHQPLTQEQEWRNTIDSLKQQGTPDAVEAIETLELLLTEKFADGGVIGKDEYNQLLREYDKTGAFLEDTEDTGDIEERARLKAKLRELESKIHGYERSYEVGGPIPSSDLKFEPIQTPLY